MVQDIFDNNLDISKLVKIIVSIKKFKLPLDMLNNVNKYLFSIHEYKFYHHNRIYRKFFNNFVNAEIEYRNTLYGCGDRIIEHKIII